MLKKSLLTTLLFIVIISGFSQVANRAPFIQRPSQTTVTIAWRRANISSGKLYIGTTPGIWMDTLYSPTSTQKHYFDITGLTANTQYFYQAYSAAPGDTFTSSITSFYTAEEDTADDITFLVYGDCGYNNTPQNQVKDLMENEVADFGIVTGDVDQGIGDNYDGVFFNVYQNILDKDCHFTTIGNHDTYADGAATYLDAFYLFHNNPANSERYYSFTWGDAKFVCLDANMTYSPGSPQYNWMINELKCNDKKWLFVYCHQPPWSNCWSADYYVPFSPYFLYQGNDDMRTTLVPKWEEYGVDFVLNGHSHCYQRGDYNGIQYLISGGGGASTLDFHTNNNSPNISVEIYENHYVKFLISGNTAKYYMIDKYGVYRDSVIVNKSFVHYEPNITVTDEVCPGQNNGSATIAPVGPNAPYTWTWENSTTGPSYINLSPGTHTVDVMDAIGCIKQETFTVNAHPAIPNTIYAVGFGYTFCENDSIQLTTTPGYSYLWSTGDTTYNTYANTSGTVSVLITDSTGCTNTGSQVVTETPAPDANFTYTDDHSLLIDFNAPVNVPGSTYAWDFGDGFNETGNASTSHFYLVNGSYDVQLIVTNNCGSDTVTITISIYSNAGINSYESFPVTVAPNPFSNQTTFSFTNDDHAEFELNIYNLHGQLVRNIPSITTNYVVVEKSNLSPGTYIFELKSKRLRSLGRLVIE